MAVCLSLLSLECVFVCLFSVTNSNFFYLTFLRALTFNPGDDFVQFTEVDLTECFAPCSHVKREDTGNDVEIFPCPVT